MTGENKTQTAVSDSALDEQMLLMEIRQQKTGEFNWSDFITIGFSHTVLEQVHFEGLSQSGFVQPSRNTP